MGGSELRYVKDAFDKNWIAPVGPHIDMFEKDIEDYLGKGEAVAVQSGTAALHLALIDADVGRDDVVLCQSFTFIGSVNPVLYQGATPVFIDSELETWNICPEALETAIKKYIKIGKKPKAVIAVDLYGMPFKYLEVKELCDKYGILLIEDAAEALGSKYGIFEESGVTEYKCGLLGDYGILSFNGNKIITTSGGGALITHRGTKNIKFLSTQAKEDKPYYEHETLGYNYRISNISAAIGLGQMEVIGERVYKKRSIFNFYKENFTHIDFQPEPENMHSNRWLTAGVMNSPEDRDELMSRLSEDNIESRHLWKPMHLQPLFKGSDYVGGNNAEVLFYKGICLPSDSKMTQEDLTRVKEIV